MIQIDMEMPESCLECPLKYEATEGGSEYCCLLDKRVGETYRYRTHRETWMKDGLDEKRLPDCPLRETIRCNQCRFYEGVHNVQGCAPCAFRGIGAVMWDDYCKSGERWKG